MARVEVVCGFGPGISSSVASRFGREGVRGAIVARNRERVDLGVAALVAEGGSARGFVADLGDSEAVQALFRDVRRDLGPVTVVHWNAFATSGGNLTTATAAELCAPFDVGVAGLVAAVQSALPDLKSQEGAAVLVTGGGFAFYDATMDAMAVQWNAAGAAIGKAAQHKLVGLLGEKLKSDGIFVGEVVVTGVVKGTAFDTGQGNLDPAEIASSFWGLYTERAQRSVSFG